MQHTAQPVDQQKLLLSLAEQLKLPLLQIARRAELQQLGEEPDPAAIQATADAALRLIDSYVLSMRMAEVGSESLQLEPISVSSVLYDSAHELSKVASFYGVKLELEIAGKYAPVLTNRQGLQAAITSLGMSLIEALPALDAQNLTLQLATHRCRYGIVAGIYTDAHGITVDTLRKGTQLAGSTRQPLVGMTHASGVGVFVADALLQALQLKLQATRHRTWHGLGTVLQTNNQLQLI